MQFKCRLKQMCDNNQQYIKKCNNFKVIIIELSKNGQENSAWRWLNRHKKPAH